MRHRTYFKTTILATLVALGALAPMTARAGNEDAAEAYDKLKDLIYDERYSQAYDASRKFLADFGDSRYAEGAEFFRCYSLQRSTRDYQQAFDCYAKFLEAHPDGKWSDDARSEYLKLAKRLSDAGDPRGKAALESMAARRVDEDSEFKMSVIWEIMDQDGDVPFDVVADLLTKSKDPDVRRHVVYMIAEVDDPRVVDLLIQVAETDPDPDIRRHAVYALSEYADEDRVISAMVQIMKTEKDADIRRHILYAIAETESDEVTGILINVAQTDPDPDARRAATFALAEVDAAAATAALESIVETSDDEELQRAALYALIERDDVNIIPTLKKIALSSPGTRAGRELRHAAVYALAEVDDPSVVPVLTEIIKTSGDSEVRRAAFYALAEHGGPEAEALLRTAAMDTRDEGLAQAAVWALTDVLDDDDATEFFMEVFRQSPFEGVRKAALYAAMSGAGEASAPALGQMLEAQEDPDQRKAIVWALSEIDSDESVAILARAARNDPSREVRRAAVQALGAIGTPAAKQALHDLLNER